jgi:hypothetical protein
LKEGALIASPKIWNMNSEKEDALKGSQKDEVSVL